MLGRNDSRDVHHLGEGFTQISLIRISRIKADFNRFQESSRCIQNVFKQSSSVFQVDFNQTASICVFVWFKFDKTKNNVEHVGHKK